MTLVLIPKRTDNGGVKAKKKKKMYSMLLWGFLLVLLKGFFALDLSWPWMAASQWRFFSSKGR